MWYIYQKRRKKHAFLLDIEFLLIWNEIFGYHVATYYWDKKREEFIQ